MRIKPSNELGIFTMKTIIVAFVVSVVIAFGAIQYSQAERKANNIKDTISVEGIASLEKAPDVFSIVAGVKLEGTDPVALQNDASTKINSTIENLKILGIAEEDIKTAKFELGTKSTDLANVQDKITFEVLLEIDVKELTENDSRPAEVIKIAFENGLNKISNITYSVEDIESVREQLKLAAIDDANDKKDELENKIGVNLGRVVDVSLSYTPRNYSNDYSYSLNKAQSESDVQAINIQVGSQKILETVIVTYEVE